MKKLKIVLAAVLCAVMAVCFVACTPGGSDYEINYDIDLNNKPQLNVLMPYSENVCIKVLKIGRAHV